MVLVVPPIELLGRWTDGVVVKSSSLDTAGHEGRVVQGGVLMATRVKVGSLTE